MKFSIYLSAALVLPFVLATGMATAQDAIIDSGVPTPLTDGGTASLSDAPLVGAAIDSGVPASPAPALPAPVTETFSTAAPAQGYAGDLGSSSVMSGEVVSGEIVSGGTSSGVVGEVVDGGVISEEAFNSGFSGMGADIGNTGGARRAFGRPDLFYNYFTQGNANRANAQMYTSPNPVPPNVGHTFFTYQPFYPEEYLYWHANRFHNHYDSGRGMNRTRAVYYSPPVRQAISNMYWNKIRLPR